VKLLEDTLQEISIAKGKKPATKRRPALMAHVVLGYPNLKESIQIVKALVQGGANIIELQIPFSDPIADGPTIMLANQAAIVNGITPKHCLKAMEELSTALPEVPLLFMTYYNIAFNYQGGLSRFCRDSATAGAEGLIIPDVPPEEKQEDYWNITQKNRLSPIPIVTPITPQHRLKKLCNLTQSGFVYCVAVTGTTGARRSLPLSLRAYLQRVRKCCSLPLAVGFGISQQSQVRALSQFADIVVVGSATIDLINRSKKQERLRKVEKFIAGLLK